MEHVSGIHRSWNDAMRGSRQDLQPQPQGWESMLRDMFGGQPAEPEPEQEQRAGQREELEHSDEYLQQELNFVAYDWSKTRQDFRRVCAMEPAIGEGDGRATIEDFADLPEQLRFQQVQRTLLAERPTRDVAFSASTARESSRSGSPPGLGAKPSIGTGEHGRACRWWSALCDASALGRHDAPLQAHPSGGAHAAAASRAAATAAAGGASALVAASSRGEEAEPTVGTRRTDVSLGACMRRGGAVGAGSARNAAAAVGPDGAPGEDSAGD